MPWAILIGMAAWKYIMDRNSWILKSHPVIEAGLVLSVLMYAFYGFGLYQGKLLDQAVFVGVGLGAIGAAVLGATRYAQWDTVIGTLCRLAVLFLVLLLATLIVADGTSLQLDPIPLLKTGTALEKVLTTTLGGTLLTAVIVSVGAIIRSLMHLRTDSEPPIEGSF